MSQAAGSSSRNDDACRAGRRASPPRVPERRPRLTARPFAIAAPRRSEGRATALRRTRPRPCRSVREAHGPRALGLCRDRARWTRAAGDRLDGAPGSRRLVASTPTSSSATLTAAMATSSVPGRSSTLRSASVDRHEPPCPGSSSSDARSTRSARRSAISCHLRRCASRMSSTAVDRAWARSGAAVLATTTASCDRQELVAACRVRAVRTRRSIVLQRRANASTGARAPRARSVRHGAAG